MKGVASSSVERDHLDMRLPTMEEDATSIGGVATNACGGVVGESIAVVGAITLGISSA